MEMCKQHKTNVINVLMEKLRRKSGEMEIGSKLFCTAERGNTLRQIPDLIELVAVLTSKKADLFVEAQQHGVNGSDGNDAHPIHDRLRLKAFALTARSVPMRAALGLSVDCFAAVLRTGAGWKHTGGNRKRGPHGAPFAMIGTEAGQPSAPWHCLNFLPEPQGQGSLRLGLPHVD